MTAVVDGPAWAQQGLDQRDGRYPLAVEAPVLGMVATLMPGVSTLTDFARYYALYWALADYAERHDLDGAGCQQILRRSEVLLALATRLTHHGDVAAHGADALQRGLSQGQIGLGAGGDRQELVLAAGLGVLVAVRRPVRCSRYRDDGGWSHSTVAPRLPGRGAGDVRPAVRRGCS